MPKNHLIKNAKNEFNINSSLLNFTKSNDSENLSRRIFTPNSFGDVSKSLKITEQSLINSFECENDVTLGAGEYSFLIYGGQYLTLFNIDSQLHKTPWDTNSYDSIKQIRWSSYHRSYLIMTARMFCLFVLFSYELLPIKISFQPTEYLQLFTCYQTDLWLVCLLSQTKRQILVHYDLSQWERNNLETKRFCLDKLRLYRTDIICAIENDQHGEYLALLIAERNQNLTVGIQRRRRLILITIYDMSPKRIVYFSGADDPYWTLASVMNRTTGWLLGKWIDNELTFIDSKCNDRMTCINYKKQIRNLAITVNGHYLVLRTINSLDIYQIDKIF